MICEYFRVTGTHEIIFDFCDLMGELTWRRCAVFHTRWNEVLLSEHEVPPDGILESLYKTLIRESDQLKTVLALYEQDIFQKDMPPSFQRLKTMVKTSLEQKKGAPSISRPETKEPWQEHQRKAEAKGSQSTLKANREVAITGKQKGSVQGKMLAVPATTAVNVEQVHVLPLPLREPQTNNDGKSLSKGTPPRGSGPCGTGSRSRAKIILKGIAQLHRVIHGTLPCVKITDYKQDASWARSFRSCTRRRTDRRRKQRGVEKTGQLPFFGV